MKAEDLAGEMFAAASRVEQRHLDHIRALGVAHVTIAELGRAWPAFGVSEAQTEATGLYQPSDGPMHIVMPVLDAGVLVDLVAWRTTRPDRWWLRTGNGWALNPDDLREYYRWGAEPPVMRASPLDWLRTGAVDSVVLDWDAREIGQLRLHERIDCDGDRVAAALRNALHRAVRMPKITAMTGRSSDVA